MKVFYVLLIAILISLEVNGKIYSKCEFARKMKNSGFPISELPDWVCLVQHESGFDTTAMNKQNTDGSWDWGIFQINDRYWCRSNHIESSNGCNINCNDLLDDDISNDIKCVKKICAERGSKKFEAWEAWKSYCRGQVSGNSKYSVKACFDGEF